MDRIVAYGAGKIYRIKKDRRRHTAAQIKVLSIAPYGASTAYAVPFLILYILPRALARDPVHPVILF